VRRLLAAAEGTIRYDWRPQGLHVCVRVPLDD